ncbi:cytochrome P450 [Colletotrichum cereale]|nr:cytochrome P450 [Colletotrichum cereale]
MAREYLYLASSAVLGGYVLWTAAETYFRWSRISHLTSSHAHAHPVLAALLFLPALVLYNKAWYLSNMKARGCGDVPLCPQWDPVFGIDWVRTALARQRDHGLLEWWSTLFAKLGNTWWFKTPTGWVLMTAEPANLKSLLASDFGDFPITGPRRDVLLPMLGPEAIFVSNGDEWHRARAMMRPTFVRNQIADLNCFERHVGNLMGRIPKDGATVDLQELLYMMTMDSATDFMFGHSTNMLTTPSPEAHKFALTFDSITTTSGLRARQGLLTSLHGDKKSDERIATVHRFSDQYIKRKAAAADKADAERDYVFLYDVMGQPGATPEYVRAQLLSMILAGRDTTASTLSALFWILARDEAVMRRLRGEVDELQGRKPSWEEMRDMKYLNMVLKEILRLYPSVATMSRGTARDTTLPVGGGPDRKSPVFVPKGTTVRWSIFHLQRRKDLYGEDADEFRPDRWDRRRPGWDYIPFSGGPRICIGQQFALTQMGYFVVRVLQTFKDISPRDDRPMQQMLGITTKLPNDVLLSFTPA